jgi:steroid 5-alpha reductase family enzyme
MIPLIYVQLFAVVFLYMSIGFLIACIRHRNDIADVMWGMGFVILAWAAYLIGGGGIVGLLVGVLVSVWGIRLSYHIYKRNKGKAEDYRYAAWRQEWGKWFYLRSYLQVFLLQGVLLYIAVPVMMIMFTPAASLGLYAGVGVCIWLIGFFFEARGDAELARFLKDPQNKGTLIQTGLWRYTRHPNYFGEVTQWWGIWVIALSVPWGYLSVIGPLMITLLILKISGIPLLEKKMELHPDFAEYKRKTSIFFPLPPKT